jgi:hypothetical protein
VIRYSLNCEDGHVFESWFPSSKASEMQLKRGLVDCPVCGSAKVSKAIMAPAIAATARKKKDTAASQPVALISEKEQETRKLLKALHDHVKKNSEHVGEKFPALARQMHYEEIPSRSIYGEAKPQEVRDLLEEGVEVAPLPPLPEKGN